MPITTLLTLLSISRSVHDSRSCRRTQRVQGSSVVNTVASDRSTSAPTLSIALLSACSPPTRCADVMRFSPIAMTAPTLGFRPSSFSGQSHPAASLMASSIILRSKSVNLGTPAPDLEGPRQRADQAHIQRESSSGSIYNQVAKERPQDPGVSFRCPAAPRRHRRQGQRQTLDFRGNLRESLRNDLDSAVIHA